ncbi:neurofilament medium polypeptide-like [Pseudochaenichthys georgianus]|uniref:neurofilament medium polypeptide-like n=1 Tax=Pseudochaenichthys georgianus TaxID=52239 RepID=UPI00146C987B|nr:X-linked retinitis pigmentosa GTPase regulator-interacting protein 1-like [Pseudochaenichthys georgianus]
MTKGETELAGEQQHRASEEEEEEEEEEKEEKEEEEKEEGEEEGEHDKGAQHQTAAGQELAAASVKEGQDKSKAAVPGPPDISQSKAEQPKQPHLKFFPRTLQGDRRRCFSKDWFNSHKWLEYSQVHQSKVNNLERRERLSCSPPPKKENQSHRCAHQAPGQKIPRSPERECPFKMFHLQPQSVAL